MICESFSLEVKYLDLKLQEIVSNEFKIILQIVNIISDENRWHSIEEIIVKTRMDERNVKRYLCILYDLTVKYNEENCNIIKLGLKKDKGIKLISKQEDLKSTELFNSFNKNINSILRVN